MNLATSVADLREDSELSRFVVTGKVTGRQLGSGCYGTVEEVEVDGKVYVGKRIHEHLITSNNIAEKYVQECRLLSELQCPNITSFLGVVFLTDYQLPLLVTEKLDGSLDDLLETIPGVPLALKCSILEDIARGLHYLHKYNPPIVHKDLTAKNVLLTTSLEAKISDFVNSHIVTAQPDLSSSSTSLMYKCPDSLHNMLSYPVSPSVDVFSFGHIVLFTITQVFPGDLLEVEYVHPTNPNKKLRRSEVERRKKYYELLSMEDMIAKGQHHPLAQLSKDCLNNNLEYRPTAQQIVTALKSMEEEVEGASDEISKVDAVKQVSAMKELLDRYVRVREKVNELTTKSEDIKQFYMELEHTQQKADGRTVPSLHYLEVKVTQLTEHQHTLMKLKKELEQKEEQFLYQLQQKSSCLQRENAELKGKDTQLTCIGEQLQLIQKTLEEKLTDLNEKDSGTYDKEAGDLYPVKSQLALQQDRDDPLHQLHRESELQLEMEVLEFKDALLQKKEAELVSMEKHVCKLQLQHEQMKSEMREKNVKIRHLMEESKRLSEVAQTNGAQLCTENFEKQSKNCISLQPDCSELVHKHALEQIRKELQLKDQELHQKELELDSKNEKLLKNGAVLQQKNNQFRLKEDELRHKDQKHHQAVAEYQEKLSEAYKELKAKESDIKRLTVDLKEENGRLEENNVLILKKERELSEKDKEIKQLDILFQRKIQDLSDDLKQKYKELEQKTVEFQQKDEDLRQKQDELRQEIQELNLKRAEYKERLSHTESQLQEKDSELILKMDELGQKEAELEQKNRMLLNNDEELHEKKEEIKSIETQLQNKHDEIQQMDEKLNKKDVELQQKDHEVHLQMDIVQQKKLRISEIEIENHQLHLQIDQLKEQLCLKNKQLIEKDAHLEQNTDELQQKAAALERSGKLVQEKEDELQQKEANLKKLEVQLHKKKDKIQQLNEELRERYVEFEQQDSDLHQNSSDLHHKESENELEYENQEPRQKLAEHERTVCQRNKQLEEKDVKLRQMFEELKQKKAELEQNNVQKDVEIQEYKEELGKLNTLLCERSDEFSCMRENFKLKDDELALKNEDITRRIFELQLKEDKIKELTNELQLKDANFKELIQGKDDEVRKKRREIRHVEDQLQEMNEEIQQMNQDLKHRESEINSLHERMKNITKHKNKEEVKSKDTQMSTVMEHIHQLQAAQIFLRTDLDQRNADVSGLREEVLSMKERLLVSSPTNRSQASQIPPHLKFQCRRGKDMPVGIHYHPQAITFRGKVYLGGGKSKRSNQVFVYESEQELWAALPPYQYELFAMTIVNNQLVLVGGEDTHTRKKTNILGVWNKKLCSWTHPFRPMLTTCSSPTVVTYQNNWLIVAGGCGERGDLSTTAVMDISNNCWYSAPSLPIPASRMSTVVFNNTMVVLGGASNSNVSINVFAVDMDDLIWQAITQETTLSKRTVNAIPAQTPWQKLPDTPLSQSTAMSLNGALLAVGGKGESVIHLYHPESRSWVKVGDLPTERVQCASTVLTNGEVLLAGGADTEEMVEILTIL